MSVTLRISPLECSALSFKLVVATHAYPSRMFATDPAKILNT